MIGSGGLHRGLSRPRGRVARTLPQHGAGTESTGMADGMHNRYNHRGRSDTDRQKDCIPCRCAIGPPVTPDPPRKRRLAKNLRNITPSLRI